MNFYEILNVAQNATQEEITNSYRKQARLNHPDMVGNNSTIENFKKIVEAYETLSDMNKRAIYNSKLPKLKPIKPKSKSKFYNPVTKRWEIDYWNDPNLGNIINVPQKKDVDIWGDPIPPPEKGFRDSAVYYDINNPEIR